MAKWAGTCKQTDGTSEPDADGDTHTHTCGSDKGHSGRHQCEWCPHTW